MQLPLISREGLCTVFSGQIPFEHTNFELKKIKRTATYVVLCPLRLQVLLGRLRLLLVIGQLGPEAGHLGLALVGAVIQP